MGRFPRSESEIAALALSMEFPEGEEDIVEFALRIAEWLEQHPARVPAGGPGPA